MAWPFFRPPKVIGSSRPEDLYLGRYHFRENGQNKIGPEIRMPGLRTVLIIGKPRSGKDTGIIVPSLLTPSGNISQVLVDTRLEGAAITLPYRQTLGQAWLANPFNEHTSLPGYAYMQSHGLNLLCGEGLDPDHPLVFENLCAQVLALIPKEGEKNPFFPLSAQALWAGLGKQELKEAKREGRKPSWFKVRMAASQGEAALRMRVKQILAEGDSQICSLLADFANASTDGIRDAVATGTAHTRWILSNAYVEDELLGAITLSQLGQVPSTLYFGVPHHQAKFFAPYQRLVISEIIRHFLTPHQVPVRIFMNELAAMGKIEALDAIGLVSGSGIQLVLIVQSLVQLRDIWGHGWESFFGQCGAVALVGSPGDEFTAEYLSKHSGETNFPQTHTGWSQNSHGPGVSMGDAFKQRPFLMRQDLNDIPDGEGWIWLAGLKDPVPAIYPPYHKDRVLSARARSNPFRQ
jgi:type IV secretory pathway TraG/TraD family ATPase VirD4